MDRGKPVDLAADLAADAQNGLYLCPCDVNPGNFKKLDDGTVVALDFGATCFLPPTFFAVAVRKLGDIFPQSASTIGYRVMSMQWWRPLISWFPSKVTT
jgi:hypothetical protein